MNPVSVIWCDSSCRGDRPRTISHLVMAAVSVSLTVALVVPARSTTFEDLVEQSTIVIRGTVQQLRAVTMPIVPVSDSTLILSVDAIVLAPVDLGNFARTNVTLIARDPQRVKVGDRADFFVTGLLFGNGLLLVEVGHMAVTDPDTLRARIRAANQRLMLQRLKRRLDSADIVIAGKVTRVRPANLGRRPSHSEHDPDWWEAEVRVQSVEKGAAGDSNMTVLYPNSHDILWSRTPRFAVDQSGIWLLRRQPRLSLLGSTFTALDSLDFVPPSLLGQVHDLIRSR
jgi:hypothetical protein